MKIERGEIGYIHYMKRRQLLMTFVMIGIGLVIFTVGLLLNKGSKSNLFTIFGILFVLPMANHLVKYIVLFPYHSNSEEETKAMVSALPEATVLMHDVIITSSEKSMELSYLFIGGNQVAAVVGGKVLKKDVDERARKKKISDYLSKIVHSQTSGYQVRLLDNTDQLVRVMKESKVYEPLPDEEKLIDYMKCMIV